jgi:hypothetical protein
MVDPSRKRYIRAKNAPPPPPKQYPERWTCLVMGLVILAFGIVWGAVDGWYFGLGLSLFGVGLVWLSWWGWRL